MRDVPDRPIVVSLVVWGNRGDFVELDAAQGRIAECLLDA
jgi:hypothetical protein